MVSGESYHRGDRSVHFYACDQPIDTFFVTLSGPERGHSGSSHLEGHQEPDGSPREHPKEFECLENPENL